MRKDTVLLVEDSESDVVMAVEAMRRGGTQFDLAVVGGGRAAVDYLSGSEAYANRDRFPIPRLILLDLKMPDLDGFAVLKWLRAQPQYAAIPVVVLTSSTYSPDVGEAYRAGANSFIVKPRTIADLAQDLKAAMDFWLPVAMSQTQGVLAVQTGGTLAVPS
jgi:CheY-like chemotaxis protein